MKDPAAFWKFLFMIGVLLVGLIIFFPVFSGHDLKLTATVHNLTQTSLEDDVHKILAELPPARYYVQDIRLEYLPDGKVRALIINLISQQNADGERVIAQIMRAQNAPEYHIFYDEIENGIQNGDLEFADLHTVLTPFVFQTMIPKEPCAYVYVDSTPVLTQIDVQPRDKYYTIRDLKNDIRGMEPIVRGTGYPFHVTPMQRVSEGHHSGEVFYRFLLNRQY